MTAPPTAYLDRLVRQRAEAVEAAVAGIDADHLFEPIVAGSNSIGNLALHLAGNLKTLVGRIAGDVPYERDRDREFAARGLTQDELLVEFRDAIRVTREVLGRLDEATWDAPAVDSPFPDESRGEHVLRAVEHLGYHAGQIVLIAKHHA